MSKPSKPSTESHAGSAASAAADFVEEGYQAGPETWVEVAAQVYDADGEPIGGEEAFGFVFGLGQVWPAVERALEGGGKGHTRRVRLSPKQAYGERDESLVRCVARDEFPDDALEGDRFELEDSDGAILVVRLLQVDSEEVLVDFNHPLSGQAVEMQLQIRGVRPATTSEIVEAERALGQSTVQGTPLVAPERLLRGAGRRYEDASPGQAEITEPPDGSGTEENKA
jgi:FKBP-type peptidyl-prolyl cis-trans isomerase SlyD